MAIALQSSKTQALLDAQLELWHHTFSYIKSMALKSAIDLHIPDAIHDNGGTATLLQIATKVTLHISKLPYLRRLMRVLTVTGVFSVEDPEGCSGENVYGLTPASHLLVTSTPMNLSPLLTLLLDSLFVSPFLGLGEWFRHEVPGPTLFKATNGQDLWDFAGHDVNFAKLFDNAMVADSNFAMDIIIKECGDVFQGINSIIDVAGGLGGASQAISKAFPHLECSVLDIPHVVAAAPVGTEVKYISGDMFESIPPADAIFLKWIMHDWGDAECVKILKNCNKAIPSRDAGGKVVIFDMVVETRTSNLKHTETQVLFDLFIMFIDGVERDEQGWKKIIFEAGFSDYKIIPVVGVRSIIEVYP